jgi:hypothetical protein
MQSSENLQLVRGRENVVIIPFENRDSEKALSDLTFRVSGDIARYIELVPNYLAFLEAGESYNLSLIVTSPTYIDLGRQELEIIIQGKKGATIYREVKSVALEVHELSGKEALEFLEKSRELLKELEELNLEYDYLSGLLLDSEEALTMFNYELIRDNYEIIESDVNNALKALEIISELEALLIVAEEKGISTSDSARLVKLAKLSLERREFALAYDRAREAQVSYALEVKGEFGKLSYYLRNYPGEISVSVLAFMLFLFGSYKVGKLQLLKKRLKKLHEEERIIAELIKVIQIKTFKEGKMSMGEYQNAMLTYQKKLASVIEEVLSLENQRVHMLKVGTKETRFRKEKERMIDLIKGLQKDYLEKGKIEAKVYELKMKSYTRKVSEIDEKLALLEAQTAIRKRKRFFGLLWSKKKILKEGRK